MEEIAKSLLFSFELCSQHTRAFPPRRMDPELSRSLLFSFELCWSGETAQRYAVAMLDLLFSFELCVREVGGRGNSREKVVLLFSFELCLDRWDGCQRFYRDPTETCYFLLNYACSSVKGSWFGIRSTYSCYFLLNYALMFTIGFEVENFRWILLFSFELCMMVNATGIIQKKIASHWHCELCVAARSSICIIQKKIASLYSFSTISARMSEGAKA